MKKLLLGMLAIVAMVATSCQKDTDLGVKGNGEIVSVSFELDTQVSRAYSEGSKATHLQWAVYNEDGEILENLVGEDTNFGGSKNIQFDLATGDTYHLLFWAGNDEAPYTVNLADKTLTIDYTNATSNQETYDAFYAYKTITVDRAATVEVELKRPFAQLNIGANDFTAMKNAGREITLSKVVVPAYTTLNLADGTVDGQTAKTFEYAAIPTEAFVVDGYQYLAMNYILVGKDQEVVDVTFHYATENETWTNSRTVGSVPVQRNYRTNIYGKVLTNGVDVNVEINPDFEVDDKNVMTVSSAQTLQQVIEALNNSTPGSEGESVNIQLTEDINLNDLLAGLLSRASENGPSLTINAGKTLTLDLNGKTLTANYPTVDAGINLFNVLGTLNVENGNILVTREDAAFNPSYCVNVFYTSFGGTVNLNGVNATNNSGAGMAYVCDMSNATNATFNVENSTLKSSYITVRVFNNNKNGVHNVVIKNSTLEGKYCVWTQFYLADGYTQEELDRQLNLDIYNNENTYDTTSGKLPILFGYNSYVSATGNGITKVVSEDGTEVTLGTLFENGVVYRGVAGTEENTTIKKVIVEEGIATLYDRTFRRFYALEEVVLPSTLTTIGAAGSGVFQSCTNLKTVVIPESVTVLGKGTFQECSSLESINIPAGVTRIEADALRATGLKEVEFHAGVTYFGTQAFRDCKQLTKVVINAPEFTMEGNTFGIMAAPFTPMTIQVVSNEMKAYVESKLTAHAKTYITVVGPKTVTTAEELVDALESNKTVILGANLEDATIKLPSNLSNFTLRAAKDVVLKNITISAADGNAYHYDGLTFDGLTFDNSRIVLTGWRTGEETLENLTITNCVFKNISDDSNNAAVHINKDAAEAVKNFTFTNNVINGATGGSKSGVYAQVTGKVVFENNVINNVSFRPYVIQITTDDGIADSFSVKGNTFSGSSVGRAQGLGNNDAGTDAVNLVVSGNIFKDITDAQQICYWNFNAATTTADLSKNYYSIDIEANPSRIYYNRAASSVEDLKEMGIYPFYTELNADGTINLNSLKQAE